MGDKESSLGSIGRDQAKREAATNANAARYDEIKRAAKKIDVISNEEWNRMQAVKQDRNKLNETICRGTAPKYKKDLIAQGYSEQVSGYFAFVCMMGISKACREVNDNIPDEMRGIASQLNPPKEPDYNDPNIDWDNYDPPKIYDSNNRFHGEAVFAILRTRDLVPKYDDEGMEVSVPNIPFESCREVLKHIAVWWLEEYAEYSKDPEKYEAKLGETSS